MNNPKFTNEDPNITSNFNKEFEHDNLKISAVSGKIHIINNSGWVDFKNAGKCTGSGTYSDPYVIEDLIIDSGGSGTCIFIEDSDVYFTIQNCTVFNSGNTGSRTSGIYLKNVSNGKIINNNCSFNKNGILTYSSKNNTILGNIANNNSRYGIYLDSQCNDTKIDENTACFNSDYHHSYNNLIINNNASYNVAEGMRIVFTNDSKIINNTLINNGVSLHIALSQNITISMNRLEGNTGGIWAYTLRLINIFNNIISSNRHTGLDITNCNNVNITNNYISENNVGIILDGYYGDPQPAENCIISENFISDCSQAGIWIGNIFNLTITGNEMQNCGILIRGHSSVYHSSSHAIDITNLVNGKPVYYYVNQTNLEINDLSNVGQIIVVNCNQSLLSNLNIYSSSAGISLLYCNNNEISGCILNKNMIGLFLANSHNNTISGIEINSNMIGMRLEGSDFNIVINSQANSNLYSGLSLDESNNNQISSNNIHHNLGSGIHLFFSNFNLMKQNKMNFNDIGITLFLYSNNNSVIENTLIGNGQCFSESDNCVGNLFENNSCEDYNEPIPGYNLLFLLGILPLVATILTKKIKKSKNLTKK
jgi:parallel beta-helix repeat protein